MDRRTAAQEIRARWEEILSEITPEAQDRVNGRTSYVCPFCGHGNGGDGLTVNPRSRDGNGLKCFGCGFSGDILDLYQAQTGETFPQAVDSLSAQLGIVLDAPAADSRNRRTAAEDFADLAQDAQEATETPQSAPSRSADKRDRQEQTQRTEAAEAAQEAANLAGYFLECRERLNDPAAVSYLQGRGISYETAHAFGLGFDPAADPAGSGHPAPRIIIPTSPTHYVGRAIDPETPKKYAKMNNKGGAAGLFNAVEIEAPLDDCIFIVEGAMDALSILEAGEAAVGLNSTSNVRQLLEKVEKHRPDATLILCLDNDERGRAAAEDLRAGLNRLNAPYITADICGGHKDPNEALTADRAAFVKAVKEARRRAGNRPDSVSEYIRSGLMGEDLSAFKSDIKTGFYNLDEKTGGLYAGLYCIAAISSLGKTTFALQLADQIAAAGNDVLFFSMEQSRLEMVTKCISRRTGQKDPRSAVSSLQIRRGDLTGEPRARVAQATADLQKAVGERLSIIEGNFDCTCSYIGDYIRQYIRRTNTRPVIFLDYLQILQPETNAQGRQQTTKETVDATVTALKRISREMGLTIFVISSVNRANYLAPIDFESLKESGGIEYTVDCLWGLQLQAVNDPLFDKKEHIKEKRERMKEAKRADPRKVELVCLKNRYGVPGWSVNFDYFPQADLYRPGSDFDDLEDSSWADDID